VEQSSFVSIFKFFRMLPSARAPVRADRSALGTLPVAAYMHCEAVAAASSIGFYVFSPLDFTVVWDGRDIIWTYDGAEAWYPLKSVQFPAFSQLFDAKAPSELAGLAPPFLTCTAQPGLLQIWTGLLVRTSENWSTLIRPLVNYPQSRLYTLYEGVVETDRWFGPLFTNVRLNVPDQPIRFDVDMPLFQIQPVPHEMLSRENLQEYEMSEQPCELTISEWLLLKESFLNRAKNMQRNPAEYAASTRRRRKLK
jgi:hypothetical protein